MRGIYTNKDLCPICKKRHITYMNMEICKDDVIVCSKECKQQHENDIKNNSN